MRRLFPLKTRNSEPSNCEGGGKNAVQSLNDSFDSAKENSDSNVINNNNACPHTKTTANIRVGHGNSSRASCSSIFSAEKCDSSLTCSTASSSSHLHRQALAAATNASGYGARKGGKSSSAGEYSIRSNSVPKDRPYDGPSYPPPRFPMRSNSTRITHLTDDNLDVLSINGSGAGVSEDNFMVSKRVSNGECKLNLDWPPCSRQSLNASAKITRSRSFNASNNLYQSEFSEKNFDRTHDEVGSAKSHSSTGSSVSGRISSRYYSARSVAEKFIRSLPGKSKSKTLVTEKEPSIAHSDGRIRQEFLDSHNVGNSSMAYESLPEKPASDISCGNCLSEKNGGEENKIQGLSAPFATQREVGRNSIQMWLEGYEVGNDTDIELERRAKEAQDRAEILSKQFDSLNSYSCSTGVAGSEFVDPHMELLQHKFIRACEVKRSLAYEVAHEIRNRLTERFAAREVMKSFEREMEARIKMVETEKNVLQSSLEKELDRRSSDWSNMLEKIKSEEKRLRDRVRDLAEQNVSLQREVSASNNRETNFKTQLKEFENCMESLRTKLENAENEIGKLRSSLTDSCKKVKELEDDLDLTHRNYKIKESENNELQKLLVRLQRLCEDQEKTICGLWQGLDEGINNKGAQPKESKISKLQKEQLRLVHVEQALRKDLENSRFEVDTLRQENSSLLDRVRGWEKDSGFALINLDQELQDRLDGLQVQALTIIDDTFYLASQFLDIIKRMLYSSDSSDKSKGVLELERDQIMELEMRFHTLGQRLDSLKKSIRTQNGILKEKSEPSCRGSVRQDSEDSESWFSENPESVKNPDNFGQLQQELKAESLLSKVLKEKLGSHESELERLQEEVATLMRNREALRDENAKLQKMLSCAIQKENDLQLLVEEQNSTICRLETDLEESLIEANFLREELPRVSKERDALDESAKELIIKNKLLGAEVVRLKSRVEKLDEDVLLKEGQLQILKENFDRKSQCKVS